MKRLSFQVFLTILLLLAATVVDGQVTRRVSVKVTTEKAVPRTNLRIRFVEMVEDSRCPTDTNCVWAGNAKVKIQVRAGKARSQMFELNSTTQPNVVSFGGYEISLLDLTPRPRSNIRINRNGYVATLSVKKT